VSLSNLFLPPDAIALDQIHRVLVIKLRNLGDVCWHLQSFPR
jgi:hypothetical protein